jgi:hypothetical protein
MEAVGNALYTAMRDDTTMRTLLGAPAASPYGVFHADLPQGFDFSPSTGKKSAVTYFEVTGTVDHDFHGIHAQAEQALYNVTVYARVKADAEAIHRRVKWILQDKRLVTQPTSGGVILGLKRESLDGAKWDEAWKCFYMTSIYRVWAKEEDYH